MFHDRFPKGAQVNRYESTVAYVYTQGSAFAFEANKLCFEEKWGELFEQYGHIMRCLWMYVEKMQARYGTSLNDEEDWPLRKLIASAVLAKSEVQSSILACRSARE